MLAQTLGKASLVVLVLARLLYGPALSSLIPVSMANESIAFLCIASIHQSSARLKHNAQLLLKSGLLLNPKPVTRLLSFCSCILKPQPLLKAPPCLGLLAARAYQGL